jgi:hypothetical protein
VIDEYPRLQEGNKDKKYQTTNAEGWHIYQRTINKAVSEAGISRLEEPVIGKDDIELRFWMFPGASYANCFRLQKLNGKWSGAGIGVDAKVSDKFIVRQLPEPEKGWDNLWSQLTENGILKLQKCDDSPGGLDMTDFMIETYYKGEYKFVIYAAPWYNSCSDSKTVLEIYKILIHEE